MIDWLVRRINRLIVGPHKEPRRFVNNVDHTLMRRIEARRRALAAAGVEIKALRKQ